MNINTMRAIDYYAGIPLCFVGTLAKKISALFVSPDTKKQCKNVLFIGLSESGSTILADPAMVKLKNNLDSTLFFACFQKNAPVLSLLHTIQPQNIFTIRDSGIIPLMLDTLRFLLWTRKKRIDTIIDMELFSRFTALLSGFSGAARTVGFDSFCNEGLFRGDFFTHKVIYNQHIHISKNFLSLVNALLSEKRERPYSKTVIREDEIVLNKAIVEQRAIDSVIEKITTEFPGFDQHIHKLVILNTNASDLVPLRRWPKAYFISLAEMILARYPHVIIVLPGILSEISWNDSIVDALQNKRCINLAGRTHLTDLPALYTISEFMVTNDSGPAHFASVTSLPTFVLFGPETPALYSPLGNSTSIYAGLACSPCVAAANHRQSPCDDNVCLQAINPETVYGIIEPNLESLW